MEEADAVFFGQVVAIQTPGPRFRNGEQVISSADLVTAEFRVSRVWKGPIRDTLSIQTERSEISCGFEFKEGREYIVYTWRGNRTGLCTRTAPAWLAVRDFAALGFGRKPEDLPEAGPISPPVVPTSRDSAYRGGGCGNSPRAGYNPTGGAPLVLLAAAIWLGTGWRRWRK